MLTRPLTAARQTLERRAVTPVLHLLKVGATPRLLAWSLAMGLLVGINPLLGSSTFLCLVLAPAFRLNLVASQLANYLVYPLQLALFFVFLRSGAKLFQTASLPFDRATVLAGIRHQPLQTTRLLWTFEWHALVVWTLLAVVLMPALALVLRPLLQGMLRALPEDDAEPTSSS